MTITYSAFFAPTQLGTGAGILYTMPASPSTSLLRGGRVRLTNTTSGAVTATLYAVPNAGAPTAANAFLSAKSIAANDFLDIDVPIMAAGSTLQALAGVATSITAHMVGGAIFS